MKFPALDKVIGIDSGRSALEYAWVDKETVFASDANIMVVHRTTDLFDIEFIKSIGEMRIPLHIEMIKAIKSRRSKSVIYDDENKKVIIKPVYYKKIYPELHFNIQGLDVKPPDYIKVLKEAKKGGTIKNIAIKPELLKRLHEGLGCHSYEPLLMKFNAEEKAIYCKPSLSSNYNFAEGLIMPCMNDEVI